MGMSVIAWFRKEWERLVHLKDKPRAIAVGASVGVFFGFIPLWGLKTLLAIGSARLLRGSLVAAAIAVTLHDVIFAVSALAAALGIRHRLLAPAPPARVAAAPAFART